MCRLQDSSPLQLISFPISPFNVLAICMGFCKITAFYISPLPTQIRRCLRQKSTNNANLIQGSSYFSSIDLCHISICCWMFSLAFKTIGVFFLAFLLLLFRFYYCYLREGYSDQANLLLPTPFHFLTLLFLRVPPESQDNQSPLLS